VIGDVDADYVELIWNITGEKWSEAYRGGIFSGIKPNNNFKSGGGLGAWQFGARFSTYDASDISVSGTNSREQNVDKAETLTVAVNWLLNTNVKFMLNYSDTKFKANSTSPAQAVTPLDITGATPIAQDSEKIISLRAAVFF
jgi:phosphate-selective porin OprO/OprP